MTVPKIVGIETEYGVSLRGAPEPNPVVASSLLINGYVEQRRIANEGRGIRTSDLLASIRQEYKEHEDLPNTTNPDDWAKISGKKGERIVYIRTLLSEGDDTQGGRSIERVATGQYL